MTDASQPMVTDHHPAQPAGRRKLGIRWRIFLLLLAIISINYIDRGAISVALPLVEKDLGFGADAAGFILSAFFWSYALMQIPGGWLADRVSARKVVAGSTAGWGIAQALTGLATSVPAFYFLRLLLGFFEGPVYPSGGKLNATWMPSRDRSRGATLLDGGAPLGSALGGLIISGLIVAFGSWRLSFVIVGILTFGVAAFAYWYIRDDPANHHAITPEEMKYIRAEHQKDDERAAAEMGRKEGEIVQGKPLYRYMRFPSFWLMCLGWLGFDVVFYGILTWGPAYLHQTKGFDIKGIGVSTLIIFGVGFIGELVGGYLSDAWRDRNTRRGLGARPNKVNRILLGFSGVFVVGALIGVTYVPNAILAVTFLSVVLFFLRWAGIYWSVPSILGGRADAGTLGGAMNLSGNIGGAITPIVVGLIVGATGSFHFALIVFIGGGVLYFLSSVFLNYGRQLPA